MPSVDTIRTITIKGKADGVDDATAALNRLTASIAAANDNLAKSAAGAQATSNGFRVTGEGALVAANHLRQAAEAAYVFSPAFRNVVNEMAAPALKTAGTALEAVAAGIVIATNYAGTGLIKLSGAVLTAVPAFAPLAASMKATGLALEAFSPSLSGVASTILSKVLPALSLLGKAFLIVDVLKLVGDAIQGTRDRLLEMIDVATKSQDRGVSAEFFQSFIAGAKGAEDRIVSFEAALSSAFQATKPVLNPDWTVWDTGLTKVTAVEKAMRDTRELFTTDQNYSGFDLFKAAGTQGDKIKAVLVYMQQLKGIGQEVAALDIGERMFGAKFTDDVRLGKESFDDMRKTIESGSKLNFVSEDSAKNAKDLDDRLKDAHNTISERLKPDWDDLANAVLRIKGLWVSILESVAAYNASKIQPAPFQYTPPSDADARNNPDPNSAAFGSPALLNMYRKRQGLAPDISPAAPVDESRGLDTSYRGAPVAAADIIPFPQRRPLDAPPPPKVTVDTSAYDRAEESLRRYTETTMAASKSVDEAASSQERLKAIAQLTAAGMKDGLTREVATQKAEMSGLATEAGIAADALAKARAVSQIDFASKTAFLSQDDVSIAQQLKGIYGNDVPAALSSTYAASIRVNNAFKQISSAIEGSLTTGLADIVDGTKSVGQGFADMSKVVIRAIEEMIIKITVVQPLMAALQSAVGGGGILSVLGVGGGAGVSAVQSAGSTGLSLGGTGGLYHTGGIVGSEPTSTRYIHPSYFDDAPRFHTGGIAGNEVPIIAKRGEGVFTEGQMAAMGGSGSSQNISIGDIHINVPEGTSADNASAIGMAVKSSMLQVIDDRLAYHSRARGMLNSAA